MKFASTLNVQSSTEKEDSKDLGKKKKVRYAEDIALEYLENEAEAKRQAMLEEFKTTDDKGSLRRSKSELYQGESCVFDLFREAQSTQFYQEILADHEKVQIGGSPLFSNLDESEGKSQFFDITGSQLGKKAVKVNILGPVGSETYKKRQEDDEGRRRSLSSVKRQVAQGQQGHLDEQQPRQLARIASQRQQAPCTHQD